MSKDMSINAKFGLDSTGFQQGISEINRKLKLTQEQFNVASTKLGEFANKSELSKLKVDSLSKQFELQQQKVKALEEAYNKSVETKGKDAKATQNLELQLLKAQKQEAQLGNELKKVSSEADNQGGVFQKLQQKLHFTLDDIKTAFGAVGLAAGTYLKGAIDSAVSAEASNKRLIELLQNQGLSAEQATQKVNEFKNSMVKMSTYSGGEAKEALQNLTEKGISVSEAMNMEATVANIAAGRNLSLKEASDLLADAYHGKTKALISLGIATKEELSTKTKKISADGEEAITVTNNKEALKEFTTEKEKYIQQTKEEIQSLQTSEKAHAGKTKEDKEAVAAIKAQIEQKKQLITQTENEIKNAKLNEQATKSGTKATKDASKASLDFDDIQKRLNDRFAGSAQAQLNTYAGQMKQFQNQMGALKTSIGTALLPALTELAKALSAILIPIAQFGTQHPKMIAAILSITAVLGTLIGGLALFQKVVGVLSFALGPLSTALGAAGLSFSSLTLPILAVIAVIAALSFAVYEVINHWSQITGFFSRLWRDTKNLFLEFWNWLKGFVINWGPIILTLIAPFIGIPLLIKQHYGELTNFFSSLFGDIERIFNNLARSALNWGHDLIDGLVNGIKNKIGQVEDAAKSVANKITSYLHFSVPDEGPLTQYESWMPDFMGGLAKGIEQNKHKVTNAIKSLSTDMSVGVKMQTKTAAAGATASNNPSSKNITINFNGSYSFNNKQDIDYFMNSAALMIQRRKM